MLASTNLVIDIGNTRTKLAIFDGVKVVDTRVAERLPEPGPNIWPYNQNVQNIILSSTAEVPEGLEFFFRKKFQYIRLSHETPLPIEIKYRTPETLGRDRIAAAVGAWTYAAGENVLAIDAGTCITMDVVSAGGVFLGGNISPGIEMRWKAMHHFTAKLPLVKTVDDKRRTADEGRRKVYPEFTSGRDRWLGDSTGAALRNGGTLGALLEVRGFVAYCRRRFRPLKVIFTGGDADFFVKNFKTKIFAHQNLVLEGLNQILRFNVNQPDGF